jgi:hypothetical protein
LAEIFNLRQARKRKVRAEKEKRADDNRRLHGLSKSEKMVARAERNQANRFLDEHKLEKSDSDRVSSLSGNENPKKK